MKFHPEGPMRCLVIDPFQQITISPSQDHPGYWNVERLTDCHAETFRRPIRLDALSFFLRSCHAPQDIDAWTPIKQEVSAPVRVSANKVSRSRVVYFLAAGPFVKIGFTGRSVQSRIDQMKTGCPYEIHLLATIPGDYKKERELHQKFDQHRAHLEWFFAADEIINYIKEHADESRH